MKFGTELMLSKDIARCGRGSIEESITYLGSCNGSHGVILDFVFDLVLRVANVKTE